LKNIHGESFEIRLEDENSTVVFKGALRLCGTEDYAPILDMLEEATRGLASMCWLLRQRLMPTLSIRLT
jgi:hypothetical protein